MTLTETFSKSLNLGVSQPNGNGSTSVHHVATVKKPPPCISFETKVIVGIKTPRRRKGKKIQVVIEEQTNGKITSGEHGSLNA
jgi:hypothetical protein